MKNLISLVVFCAICIGVCYASEYSPRTGVITLTNNGDTWTNPTPAAAGKIVANAIQFVPAATAKQTILRDGSATGQVLAYFKADASTTDTKFVSASFSLPNTLYLWSDDTTTAPGPRLLIYTAPKK